MAETQALSTDPVKVAEYGKELQEQAQYLNVRGLIAFEDRGDTVQIVEVGSCSPLSSRMLLGLARFVIREISGL